MSTATYTPNPNYNGTDSFTYIANDGALDSNTETVSLTITSINDDPILTAIGNQSTNEDTNLTLSLKVSDVDSADAHTFTVTSGTNIMASISGDQLTFIPDQNFHGTENFTISVTDSGDPALTDSETITVTVTPVNDAPSITTTSLSGATEDTAYSATIEVSDVDDANNGSDLSFSLSNQPTGMSISNTGTISWTPTEGVTSSDEFTVTVADGQEDSASPASQVFTIPVTPVNDAPTDIVLSSHVINENEGTNTIIGELSTTDSDDTSHTYEITAGDTDAFAISGNNLVSSQTFDFETKNSYSITIQTSDSES